MRSMKSVGFFGLLLAITACSGQQSGASASDGETAKGGSSQSAGGASSTGSELSGGAPAAMGGGGATGGFASSGASPSGGSSGASDTSSRGGSGPASVGGAMSTGTGGSRANGGSPTTGGSASRGGTTSAGSTMNVGGAVQSGGATSTGGKSAAGGAAAAGGRVGAGGTNAGGSTGSGGATVAGGSPSSGGGNSDPNEVDVYLLAGQSNATGQGYSKNIPASFTINTNVQLYHSADIVSGAAANTWIILRAASEGTDGCGLGYRFGPELGFGNAAQSYYPSRKIAIIKHAKSNTNLYAQWAPGSSATDTGHFGAQFKTFVATVDGGLQALKSKGLVPKIRAILWQQGEADADAGGQNYGANLKAFIARVREQWSAPDMLFVYGYVYPASNFGTGRDIVRQGETDVDQDSGSTLAVKGAFVVLTDDLGLRANDPNTCYPSDLIHFGTQGQLELGKRMASKVHDHLAL